MKSLSFPPVFLCNTQKQGCFNANVTCVAALAPPFGGVGGGAECRLAFRFHIKHILHISVVTSAALVQGYALEAPLYLQIYFYIGPRNFL
jgi:hypothetical protein